MGRNNPNCKYNIDDNLFSSVDSREKAYLLGWIASDGSVGKNGAITIAIQARDRKILERLKDFVCEEIPIYFRDFRRQVSFTFNSTKITEDVCRLLKIRPGKKSHTVDFPDELKQSSFLWDFIRGYFDGGGGISSTANKHRYPSCNITSYSQKMLDALDILIDIPHSRYDKSIEFFGPNAIDFMSKIYNNCGWMCLERNLDAYERWSPWEPAVVGASGRRPHFTFSKTRNDAVAPSKKRASDSGYDLTLIDVHKKFGRVTLYDTGIKVKPFNGWYFDLVARSSLIKTGYILSNGIGVIDMSYTGNIYVALMKIDENKPDIELPFRAVQLVPRPIIHAEFIQVDELDETTRNHGGFGSTGVN